MLHVQAKLHTSDCSTTVARYLVVFNITASAGILLHFGSGLIILDLLSDLLCQCLVGVERFDFLGAEAGLLSFLLSRSQETTQRMLKTACSARRPSTALLSVNGV